MFYNNNLVVIISSPSGAGKTTVTKKLLQKINRSYLSISCTTRQPRKNEKNGVDYFFLKKSEFLDLKKNKKFLETAKVFDHFYGTLKSEFYKKKNKKIIFLDVDWQGARNIRKNISQNCFSFFLLPPSISELKRRLLKRHKDNKSIAIKRLSSAKKDIKHWDEYDYVFVNKDLNKCIASIIKKIQILLDENKEKIKIKKIIEKF